jgi:hypothetical protein
MFYARNLPRSERWARALLGAGIAALGVWLGKGWAVGLLAGSGAGLALTGFIGFCPFCAMVGRKPR